MEAEKVKEILDNWNVTEKIIALGFDTTSSNTGIHKGSCTILQQLLERQLLWLSCRHHIPERIIAVSFITLFGETKGPDVPLFKTLKNCWDNLDLSNIKLPDIPSCYDGDVDSLLSYINDKLEPKNLKLLPRCDYKEYLELALLFLGGSIDRKKGYTYQIQRPGADHHARWMSKAIYILKLSLLQHQIDEIHWQTKKKIHKQWRNVAIWCPPAHFLPPPQIFYCLQKKKKKKKKKKKGPHFFFGFSYRLLAPCSFLYPQIFFSRRRNAKLADIWYILLLCQKIFRLKNCKFGNMPPP